MKKIIQFCLFISLILSCNKDAHLDKSLNGFWKFEISLQDKMLPMLIYLEKNKNQVSGYLLNSDEKISLDGIFNGDMIILEIGAGHGIFELSLKNDELKGMWSKANKEDYKIPLRAKKYNKDHLFKRYENKENFLNISGNWRLSFFDINSENGTDSLGMFKQNGSRVQGSILTETGDYRYLDGYIEKDHVYLFGFDGTFSFIIELTIKNDKMSGEILSGKTYHAKFAGVKDALFTLSDANSLTKTKHRQPLKLEIKDLNDNIVNITEKSFVGKIKIIQIFGSWCPNCIDETRFIVDWKKNNLDKLNHVEFLLVAFENFKEKNDAVKALNKLKYKLEIDYPILLADYKTTATVLDYFPLDKLVAFPTMLFLNKKNEIVKIHTGFSGQATGEFFKEFIKDFNITIDNLIKND